MISLFDKVMLAIAVPVSLMMSYVFFIILPVSLYADAECLKKGYPKAHVTFRLERYCSTLDGAVTVEVDKQ